MQPAKELAEETRIGVIILMGEVSVEVSVEVEARGTARQDRDLRRAGREKVGRRDAQTQRSLTTIVSPGRTG